ncbi:MAG TPA: hypothetical protein VNN55_03060 [bacterium]|nr:hypothetical protein [bacterium]
MPKRNGYQITYRLASRGVDLHSSLPDIAPVRSPYMQNCYFRQGITQRLGMTRLTNTEVETGKALTMLHRFYYGTNSKQLLAAAGTSVKAYDEVSAWNTVVTGWTDGATVTAATWGPKSAVYLANGNQAPVKWNGTTATTLSAFPTNTRQFLPVLDRLLFIDDTNPSYIGLSKSFDDTAIEAVQNSLAVPGAGKIYGLAYHGLTTSAGFATRVICAKASEMYLLTANNLAPASLDARLDIVVPFVGCEAWRTIVSTPVGTFFLGTDRKVYLITYDGAVHDVSALIRAERDDDEGIESIPGSQMSKCHAVYHDGFYKLFVVRSGGTVPAMQWWLDVSAFGQDRDGFWGPWFGPMLGQTISAAVVENGPGDGNALIGGEGTAATGGYVYTMDTTNADQGTAITMIYQTAYDAHKLPGLNKVISQCELEHADVSGSLVVSAYDTTGLASTPESQTISGSSAVYWDTKYWDEFYWSSGASAVRRVITPTQRVIVRSLSWRLEFSSASEQFKLFRVLTLGQARTRQALVGGREKS